MSKKKNKFKKRKSHQAEHVSVLNQAVVATGSERESLKEDIDSTPQPIKIVEPNAYKTDKYDYVKKDIKKILVIMSIIILVLIGIYFLSLKTTLFDTFGNWVYKLLNIQTT